MSHTFAVCGSCGAVNRLAADKVLARLAHCGKCKTDLHLPHGVSEVSLDTLDQLVRASDIPVVVDLWASWCGPCVAFAPVFSKVAEDKVGQFVFCKLNTEQNPEASGVLGIRGIPTLIAFHGGDEIKRQSGAMPEAMFRQWLLSLA